MAGMLCLKISFSFRDEELAARRRKLLTIA